MRLAAIISEPEDMNTHLASQRDHRIDFVRGLALVMIFINHIPGNIVGELTTRNFGFSDAAEIFVLLAGVSSAFAYYRRYEAGQPFYTSVRVWRRAGFLYTAHTLTTVLAIALFAAAGLYFADPALTGQIGIHAFWESRLPELFADDDYEFWVGKAQFIEHPRDYFWNMVLDSHALVDSVLLIEADLRQRFPSDQQMCYETRGETLVHTPCEAYASAYHQRMGNMVEQRMRDAILSVGSAWYTAWVLAGQPDLKLLDGEGVADSLDVGEVEGREGFFKGRKHGE